MNETRHVNLNASERYPSTPTGVRLFMLLYPLIVGFLSYWLPNHFWALVVAAMLGLAWFGAASVFVATTLRREGYQAAIDDLNGLQRTIE